MRAECQSMEVLLSQYEAGELSQAADVAWVRQHLGGCEHCRAVLVSFERLSAICEVDEAPRLRQDRASTIWSHLRGAGTSEEVEVPGAEAEILTLEEAAAFLKVSMTALEAELDTLPVFEFGGCVRIRRHRLLTWIETREKRAHDHRLFKIVGGSD